MRIVLATTAPTAGGVTRHLFDLAGGLRDRGHELIVASRRDAGAVREGARQRGLDWLALERTPSVRSDIWHLQLHNPLDLRVLPLELARRGARSGAIVITEHQVRNPRTDVRPWSLPPEIGQGRRKPGAAHLKPLMKRTQAQLADALITVSQASAKFLVERYQLDPGRVHAIHNGVRVPAEPPPPRSGPGVRVVVVGELHWGKGVDVLVDAAGRATVPWSLRVVGDGPLRADLETRAARVAPDRTIEFTGASRDAADAALEADVACLPSRFEAAAAYVLLEAMACARPVVASDVDGVDETVIHGETGLVVERDDPEALAGALDALAADRAVRHAMGAAGHARAARSFTVDRMVADTLGVYEEVVRSRGPRRRRAPAPGGALR